MTTNAEHCARYYQRNREKLLEQKRQEWAENAEEMKERGRAQYAKHREKRVAHAREYRRKHKERLAEAARLRYHANRDEIRSRRAARRRADPDIRARELEKILAWKRENPDREFFYHAKRLLSEQTGLHFSDIPDELAEAKMAQLLIHRAAKAIEARQGGNAAGGAVHESAVGNANSPNTPIHPVKTRGTE